MGKVRGPWSFKNNTCIPWLIRFPSFSTKVIYLPFEFYLPSSSSIFLSSNYIFFYSNSNFLCSNFAFHSNFSLSACSFASQFFSVFFLTNAISLTPKKLLFSSFQVFKLSMWLLIFQTFQQLN